MTLKSFIRAPLSGKWWKVFIEKEPRYKSHRRPRQWAGIENVWRKWTFYILQQLFLQASGEGNFWYISYLWPPTLHSYRDRVMECDVRHIMGNAEGWRYGNSQGQTNRGSSRWGWGWWGWNKFWWSLIRKNRMCPTARTEFEYAQNRNHWNRMS